MPWITNPHKPGWEYWKDEESKRGKRLKMTKTKEQIKDKLLELFDKNWWDGGEKAVKEMIESAFSEEEAPERATKLSIEQTDKILKRLEDHNIRVVDATDFPAWLKPPEVSEEYFNSKVNDALEEKG